MKLIRRKNSFASSELMSVYKCVSTAVILLLVTWPGWVCVCQRQDVVIQVVIPLQAGAVQDYERTHAEAKTYIKHGNQKEYRSLRDKFNIDSWLNCTDTNSPSEILSLYCTEIFTKHVNTIVSLNKGFDTEASNSYILRLADHLGYPVISWDPHYPGALQSVADSRVLQIAPTIYHQCQAMTRILSRYNWTEFAILTSTISSNEDFINCMKDMVKKTSVKQGYITKPKFKILTTEITDMGDGYLLTSEQEANLRAALQTLRNTVARVILLHAEQIEALTILETIEDDFPDLIDKEHMWILTAASLGDPFVKSTKFPVGIIGLAYNDSKEAIQEAMETSINIWARGLNELARSSRTNTLQMYPGNTCNTTVRSSMFWENGKYLYNAMKRVKLDQPVVSFSENGVIEHIEFKIYNVVPKIQVYKKTIRKTGQWNQVGRIAPKTIGRTTQMELTMEDIIWPGGSVFPPKGKPDKRFFRIVTLEEPPYIDYVPPDHTTGKCSQPAVPCKLVRRKDNPYKYGNATIDRNGMVEYCCVGLCVDLLRILSERLYFDYEMFEVHDREWGLRDNETGEWTGLIREMLKKDGADMVITSIKINYERNTAIDFSTPYLETGITILVALRKGAISATAFLEPFDRNSWILIMLISIPVVATSIFTTEWCSPFGFNHGHPPDKEHKFSLFRSFWLIWAMLFGASVTTDNPRGMSSRFLANVWALFALVFLASYTANLAAFMITIDEYYDLSGIQDWRLMNPTAVTPHFKFATKPGGSTEDNIRKNYPRMHKYMQQYNKTSVDKGITALKKGEIHAFIYDATVLEYNAGKDKDCDLITVGKWYAMTGYGVGFPKGSPYVEEVNQVLLGLQRNGEMDRLQKFWLAGACHAQKDKKDKSSHNIGIPNFTSAFILLAGGVLLGTILLLLEHCYFKFGRKCLKKYDKSGCCSLVSLSMGKSLTFEQSVMNAIDYHKRHRCKDPLCETQLWKAKHELDLALIKIERLRDELSSLDNNTYPETKVDLHENHDDIKTIGANGTQAFAGAGSKPPPESHYEIPDKVRKRGNHLDPCENLYREMNRVAESSSLPSISKYNKDNVELTDVEKKRQQFRRSPSYTNAMSTDSDTGSKVVVSGPGTQLAPGAGTNGFEKDTSPKRCFSYSQAVDGSPILDGGLKSPKQNTRTRFYDGKYYVGVASDNEDSAL